jgi:DNA-nicking Smr family endonuclease
MARKKSSQKKTASSHDFSHSPFKSLKGLSAFEAPRAKAVSGKDTCDEIKQTGAPATDHHAFADEMGFLGVKPLPGRGLEAPALGKGGAAKASTAPNASREEQDKAAFLDAVGAMTTTFSDDWPDDEMPRQAVPRRMKQVERGQLKPEAELDLHGLKVDDAAAKVRFFLQDSSYHGFQTLLIITGKGLHSADGPVLREAVEKLLSLSGGLVLEWGVAPRRYGGDGALVVFLRRPVAG